MNFRKIFLTTLVAAAGCSTAFAQTDVRLYEDFESYADTAAMLVEWPESQAGKFLLNTAEGEGAEGSDKWITQNDPASAASITRDIPSPIVAGTVDQINLSFYTRAADWGNSRSGISIRDNGLSTVLLQVGSYNAATANAADPGNKWVARIMGVPGISLASPSYYTLLNGPNRAANVWTKLELQATTSEVTFEVNDVNTGDTLSATGLPTLTINKMRVGLAVAPSKVVDYDNIAVWAGEDTSVSDWDLY